MSRTTAVQTIETLFPGIVAGDRLELQPGSRVGRLRVRGTATIASRDARGARIEVACRVLGVRSSGSIDVALESDGSISITVGGLPFFAISVTGRPQELGATRLLLPIAPEGMLDAAGDEHGLHIGATGLRAGEIDISLAPA